MGIPKFTARTLMNYTTNDRYAIKIFRDQTTRSLVHPAVNCWCEKETCYQPAGWRSSICYCESINCERVRPPQAEIP
jgi:hypothetical protein